MWEAKLPWYYLISGTCSHMLPIPNHMMPMIIHMMSISYYTCMSPICQVWRHQYPAQVDVTTLSNIKDPYQRYNAWHLRLIIIQMMVVHSHMAPISSLMTSIPNHIMSIISTLTPMALTHLARGTWYIGFMELTLRPKDVIYRSVTSYEQCL